MKKSNRKRRLKEGLIIDFSYSKDNGTTSRPIIFTIKWVRAQEEERQREMGWEHNRRHNRWKIP